MDKNTFYKVCLLAAADGHPLTGFGNGIDRHGSVYVESTLAKYPELFDYQTESENLTVLQCWSRYAKV
jgi:hypothetical protein